MIRPMMWLSLTFDHRVVDGYPAGVFLRRIQEILEKPYLTVRLVAHVYRRILRPVSRRQDRLCGEIKG